MPPSVAPSTIAVADSQKKRRKTKPVKPKSVKGKCKGKAAKAKARPKPPASDLDESNDIHAATAASDAASTEAENAEQASAAPGRGRVLTATLSNASTRSSTPMAEGGLRECKTHFDIQNRPAHIAEVVAQMTTPDMGGLETNAAITLEYAGENTTWSGCFSGVETYAIADMRMDLAYKKLNEKSRRRNTHMSLPFIRTVICGALNGMQLPGANC